MQSLMVLGSQASSGSEGKLARRSLSLIWEVGGGSVPCNMSVITQVVTECLGEDTDWLFLKANRSHFPLASSAPGSITLTFQPERAQCKQGGSLCVWVSTRTGPSGVRYSAHTRGHQKGPSMQTSLPAST